MCVDMLFIIVAPVELIEAVVVAIAGVSVLCELHYLWNYM